MQDHHNGHRCYGHRLSLHEKCAHRQGLHCRGVGLPFAVLHPAGQDHKACGAETGERRVIAFHCSASLYKREVITLAIPFHHSFLQIHTFHTMVVPSQLLLMK